MKESINISPQDCQKIKDSLVILNDIQTEIRGYKDYGFEGTAKELHTEIEVIRKIIEQVTAEHDVCAWNCHFDIQKDESVEYECHTIMHHGKPVGTIHYEDFLECWFVKFDDAWLPDDIAFITLQEAIAFAQGYCTTLDVQNKAFSDYPNYPIS